MLFVLNLIHIYRYFDATKKMEFEEKSKAQLLEDFMSTDLDKELHYIKY